MAVISLCIITYNEEKNIRRCLESARGLADEIIVVDTGSTDQTKFICEEYGARIFDYVWTGDFSAARNYGISKATGGWLLLLDADEELEVHDFAAVKRYLSDTAYHMLMVHMVHFYGEKPASEKRANFSGGLRLVRNDRDVQFTGKIHERIDVGGKSIGHTPDIRQMLRILHCGYMEDASQNKKDRNISLLIKEKEAGADDPWLDYHLAAEYHVSGNFTEAYSKVNTAIADFLKNGRKPPALVYKLKYDMLITSRLFDTAYNGIEKAIELYPDYVDLHFYKGMLQFGREEYGKAHNTFLYCIVLGETNMEHLILSGSGSFLALYYLGLCHERQGQHDEAAEAFKQSEALYPGIGMAKQSLENLEIYLTATK